jgi:hypothetical protein
MKKGAFLCGLLMVAVAAVAVYSAFSETVYPEKTDKNWVRRFVPGEVVIKLRPMWGGILRGTPSGEAMLRTMSRTPAFTEMARLNRRLNLKGIRHFLQGYDATPEKTTERSFQMALSRFPLRSARNPEGSLKRPPELENIYIIRLPGEVETQ